MGNIIFWGGIGLAITFVVVGIAGFMFGGSRSWRELIN